MKSDLIYCALKKLLVHYQIGDRLPSEQALAAEFKVARMTVRKALTQLKKQEIITAHKGKGYFLTQLLSSASSDGASFIETVPEIDNYHILHFELYTATVNLSQLINCNVGDKLFLVKKQLSAAGQIKMVIDHYIPFTINPQLSIKDISNCEILVGSPLALHTENRLYEVKFKPISAGLDLQKSLAVAALQPVQQLFIAAQKLDRSLLHFTLISFDPAKLQVRFNHYQ